MARKPREDVEGAIQHVYARGNNRMPIFGDDRDRRTFLSLLAGVIRRTRWICFAYCLMENHVHLLVETPEANLGRGMQLLTSAYARTFNDRHERSGHVFQGRYGANRVTTDEQLLMTLAYIANNPVEAGLCDDPGQWRWSSHGATCRADPPPWLGLERLQALLPIDLWEMTPSGRDNFAPKGV